MSLPPFQAPTGISGLDQLLHGGFPKDRLHLIEGEPGTGKTTLALQFLLEGRRLGESGLYVTLSETTEELHHVASSHGWTLDGFSFIRDLRQGSARGVPAIALSAYADQASREAALAAGFTAFLAKPARAETLLQLVASLLDTLEPTPSGGA